jgi:hypothetical protein
MELESSAFPISADLCISCLYLNLIDTNLNCEVQFNRGIVECSVNSLAPRGVPYASRMLAEGI